MLVDFPYCLILTMLGKGRDQEHTNKNFFQSLFCLKDLLNKVMVRNSEVILRQTLNHSV
jgi:hypothetical protein